MDSVCGSTQKAPNGKWKSGIRQELLAWNIWEALFCEYLYFSVFLISNSEVIRKCKRVYKEAHSFQNPFLLFLYGISFQNKAGGWWGQSSPGHLWPWKWILAGALETPEQQARALPFTLQHRVILGLMCDRPVTLLVYITDSWLQLTTPLNWDLPSAETPCQLPEALLGVCAAGMRPMQCSVACGTTQSHAAPGVWRPLMEVDKGSRGMRVRPGRRLGQLRETEECGRNILINA